MLSGGKKMKIMCAECRHEQRSVESDTVFFRETSSCHLVKVVVRTKNCAWRKPFRLTQSSVSNKLRNSKQQKTFNEVKYSLFALCRN